MSRTENIKRNLIFNMIKFATQLILQFVLRTVLIYFMGSQYVGISGLYTNIFSFLNLAELGIGGAIVFSMYKPIADGDVEKVKALQQLYKKLYLIIFFVVLGVGGLITPFIEFLIKDAGSININIYITYAIYLVNTLVGYFSAHKRSLLFAYQRNDVENKIRTICILAMTAVQILVIVLTKNYYIFAITNVVFTLLEGVLIYLVANKLFPEINGKAEPIDSVTKKEISKNVFALSAHKFGGVVVNSTDNVIISAFLGLSVLGAYSNYTLILTSLTSFFMLLYNALTSSVGNLMATTDENYCYEKFKVVNFIFSYLASFTTICLVCLFQPFIKYWTHGGEYLLGFGTMILLCVQHYVSRMRTSVFVFKDAAGLFWQDRWKPVIEAVINLVVSIVLVIWLGIDGVIIGTIVSTICAPLWVEPCVLYKYYFKRKPKYYFLKYLLDTVIMCAVSAVCYLVCSFIPDAGLWWLILKFLTAIVLSNILLILIYFKTREFQDAYALAKKMLHKMRKKNAEPISATQNEKPSKTDL